MDWETKEGRILNPPIIARYVRIHPKAWVGHISLRVELYGCREGRFAAILYLLLVLAHQVLIFS